MATLFDEKVWPALGSEVLGRSGGFPRSQNQKQNKGRGFLLRSCGLGQSGGEEGERGKEEGEKRGERGRRKGEQVERGEQIGREGEKKVREGEKKGREGEKKVREMENEGRGRRRRSGEW